MPSARSGKASNLSGYSGTPLQKKLGFKADLTVFVLAAPADYRTWLGELPEGLVLVAQAPRPVEVAHLFVTERELLAKHLLGLRKKLVQTGFIWVSWPKKAAKVPTDITEGTIREVALPLGFVDVKVCAVSEVWSGLKLVIRKTERS